MSQQANKITRSSSDVDKYGDLLDTKLDAKLLKFSKSLASKDDVNEIKTMFIELTKRIEDQDRKIAALEIEGQDHEERILNLENKVFVLEASVNKLQDKNAVLSSSVDFLTKQSDSQEQYSRRYCLRINGIETKENESAKDCLSTVVNICKNKLNLDISESDIDRAHRIGKEKKTIIVKFFSFAKRTEVYKARKTTNDFKVHLDLTKNRLNLLDKAKEFIVGENCPVKFVFADINCNVVAYMKSKEYKFFDNIDSFKNKVLNSR